MKLKTVMFLVMLCALWATGHADAGESNIDGVSPPKRQVILKWLGVAGWEIRTGNTVVLIDPFLSRKEAERDAEWKTDEEAVLRAVTAADYIFAGHSHADHIADITFIAKRFGSKIIGSRTTTNLALTAGVDASQVVPVKGGEKLDFEDFSVQVIESQHGLLLRDGERRQPRSREILEPWSGPVKGRDFVEGKSYLYYFSFGQHRVLHQSTGNFIEEKLSGLQPDVALLAPVAGYDLTAVLGRLKPKVIILHHYDTWRSPLSGGISRANRKRAQQFESEVRWFDRQIKVIIPEFFATYTLE